MCRSLTLARPFVGEQLVAFVTAALEGAHRVPAELITAAVVFLAFVNVCVTTHTHTHKPGQAVSTNSRTGTVLHLLLFMLQNIGLCLKVCFCSQLVKNT